MKKQFKTPKFLQDAIKELSKKEQKEWEDFKNNHSVVEIYYAEMFKDLADIEIELNSFKVRYGIDLKININKSYETN